jgi:hypothetical protein
VKLTAGIVEPALDYLGRDLDLGGREFRRLRY